MQHGRVEDGPSPAVIVPREGGSRTRADYPRDRCVHQLFEEQVRRTPDAVAVVTGGRGLTYREVNERANRLAHRLRKRGVGPGVLVGVCVGRSADLVVGLLGVLKAGGAYVPLDPADPGRRLASVLADSGAALVLAEERLPGRVSGADVLCLDAEARALDAESGEDLPCPAGPEDLAYVIYTSGSTGTPKGVMVPHRGLVNYLWWCVRAYPVREGRGAPVHSSIAFDMPLTALFGPLLVGGVVHLFGEGEGLDALADAFRAGADFGLVKITPSHLDLLARQVGRAGAARGTRAFVIGGENLTAATVAFWEEAAPDTLLVNEYGPTETVVGCCVYVVPRDKHRSGSIPIGRPIANTELYVLDEERRPVTAGEPGELYVGGDGLARGYLNRPGLTAERFVPHPFRADDAGARLYRTGDLCRYRPDGELEFLGRVDDQVKVRGYRVELGEVEAVLARHPGVRQCAVLAEGEGAGRRLVAYLGVGGGAVAADEVRRFLAGQLPGYMVPAALVLRERLPLNANGKIDRRALAAMDGAAVVPAPEGVGPRGATEGRLASIWAEVLHLPRVGVRDSFFDLGGHSLLALEVFERVRQEFGRELPLATLFRAPTVEQLAAVLDRPAAGEAGKRSLVPIRPAGTRVPFFCVHAISGDVYCFHLLARHLGLDQPFYGLQARGLTHGEPDATIEAMAARYVEEVRAVWPRGPFLLGGFSLGGVVAFEMARQLTAAGGRVGLVALFDTSFPGRGPRKRRSVPRLVLDVLRNLPGWLLDEVRHFDRRQAANRLLGKLARVRGVLGRRREGAVEPGLNVREYFGVAELPPTTLRCVQANYQALGAYTPGRYAGRVSVFRARSRPLLERPEWGLGWGRVAQDVEVHTIPGSHGTFLNEPHVRGLAEALGRCLGHAGG